MTIEFKTDAQKEAHAAVGAMMEKLFGELSEPNPEQPSFGLRMGSAYAQIWVGAWGQDDAIIQVRAFVVIGAEMTPELMHFLLRENNDMVFGAFGLDSVDDIFFEHTIPAKNCDKERLKASVMAVMSTADQYDDQIVARWGGRRVTDPAT